MARIRCKSCGKGYSYQGDCCPNCGAFNRKPSREYIGADGEVHFVDEKVCFEQKVCYEDQADKAWKESPDRKPERKKHSGVAKRPHTTRFTSSQADQVIDRFTRGAGEQAKKFAAQFLDDEDNTSAAEAMDRFAKSFREKTAQFTSKSAATTRRRGEGYAPRRHSDSSGKGAVIALAVGIIFAIAGLVFSAASNVNIIDDFDSFFEPRQEPARPDMSVTTIDANIECEDYGGYFTLKGGDQLLAFFHDVELADDGTLTVKTYCDGTPTRFRPRLVDESNGEVYDPVSIHEWQPSNFLIKFQLPDAFAEEFHYSFHYLDRETDELYSVGAFFRGADGSEYDGVSYDIPLLDGDMLYTSVLMEYEDSLLTVRVSHDHPQPGRFAPYLYDGDEEVYIPLTTEEYGEGEFCYVFNVGTANYDRTFTFCYQDAQYDAMLTVASYEVTVDGTTQAAHQWGEGYEFYLRDGGVLHANVLMHYDQRKHEIVVYASHDGDQERFHPHLSKDNAENVSLYGPPIDTEDRGEDGFCYRFDADSIDPDNNYTFCYLDGNTGDIFYTESIYLPEPPGSEVRRGILDLDDDVVVEVTAHYTYTDQVLTVYATHDGNMGRLRAFAYDTATGIYHEVAMIEDHGAGEYDYVFDLTGCDPASTISFGFEDVERSRKYFVMDCFAW